MVNPAQIHPVKIALVGAGIFARDAHVPSMLNLGDLFEIVAIFSRTKDTAATLSRRIPYPVELYTDLPAMLARDDIEALDVLLPIGVMAELLPQIFLSGKHVLSEKPIGPNVQIGLDLMNAHARHSSSVWMVGENWRYEDAFLRAADLIGDGAIGAPVTCHWAINTPIDASSKYFHSQWRRDNSIPGGYLLDGGIHHIAALRLILGEIDQVYAVTAQHSPLLPPADTIAATLRFESGLLGTYIATYVTGAPWSPYLHVTGTKGALRVQRREVVIDSGDDTQAVQCEGFDGVEKQLAAFANAICTGASHRNLPGEALQDLMVMEAMLESAKSGVPVSPPRYA